MRGTRDGQPLALGLLAWLAACGVSPEPVPPRPHAVVLITLDTARGDHFDWSDAATLPAIKRAFAGGARFGQAVAVSPVTGPSHASILTGLSPLEHRLLSNPLPLRRDVRTLAEQLHEAGYRTAAFVSSSVLAAGRGFEQGYDHYDSDVSSSYVGNFYERSAWHTTDRTLAWLRQNDAEPFHVWLHYFDPHAPYDPPGPHRPRGFEELERSVADRPTVERLQEIHEAGSVDPQERAWYRALYAGELRAVDAEIARLVAFLEERPYADRMILALTGDHGEELGDHGSYFEHGLSLHDGVMRVPLALRAPGVPAERVEAQVSHSALAATLLELAGLPAPAELEPSLLPLDDTGRQPQIFIKEPHPFVRPWGAALRDPPWKYLYWEDGREALFAIDSDPTESTNLAQTDPARAARMRAHVETAIVPFLGSRDAPALDAETREMLHALGYGDLESSR